MRATYCKAGVVLMTQTNRQLPVRKERCALLQVPEYVFDLCERGAKIVEDLPRENVPIGKVAGVFQAVVAKPEEIEAWQRVQSWSR